MLKELLIRQIDSEGIDTPVAVSLQTDQVAGDWRTALRTTNTGERKTNTVSSCSLGTSCVVLVVLAKIPIPVETYCEMWVVSQ